MSETRPSPGAGPARAELRLRLDTILLERVALGCVAMAISLGALTVASFLAREWSTAIASLVGQLTATSGWLLIRQGRVQAARAGALSAFIWLTAWVPCVLALWVHRDATQEIWLALVLWAYGAMSLHRRWAYGVLAFGATTWASVAWTLGLPHLPMHLVSIGGAVGVGVLAFHANRAVLRDLEVLRAQDAVHRAELARALDAAQRELEARRQAEAERERMRSQFVGAQRMEAVGTLAGGVAHDMNNVLASILAVATSQREVAHGELATDLDIIIASAAHGAALTRALLGYGRRAQYVRERLCLATVVDEAFAMLGRTLPKGIALTANLDRGLFIDGDRSHLVQVLLNICLNSVQALGDSGRIDVTVATQIVDEEQATELELTPGPYAVLDIKDDGSGMSAEVKARIFEPFFTTKPLGGGTGLGLAMAWGTLKDHGGGAHVESAPGQGTRFTCFLPLQQAPAASGVGQPSTAGTPRPRQAMNVLLVDDEPLVRRALARTLVRAGHRVTLAVDGLDAVEQVRADPTTIDAVVLDMSMPRMNGAACYRALRALAPNLPIVCTSGYALDDDTRELLGGDVVFLPKPAVPADVYAALERACAEAQTPEPIL